uniref:Carbohydrate kinase PfkB domain-containing protein n=1 Tax=Globisporangium ultimum (strain ATCC 200006 / CBS 805.95 / DAOM BR144) TaxID=431595 RepID=K3W7K7_GLOUD
MAWRRSGSALSKRLALSEEVAEALYGQHKKPVVALESTIISHGMPYPQNVEMAQTVENLVRAQGACPATICIADGELKVGLEAKDLQRLGEMGSAARKCSTRDIAAAVTEKVVGATTVSSTMRIAHAAGIKIFVTGGIGGVHRFVEETMDVSTDLMELSRTPVAVICAGIKSILDIPRTLEFLETHSVPVVGYQTNQFPAFFTQDSGLQAQLRRDTPQDVAALIHESRALELPNGMVIAVPNPNPMSSDVINNAIELGLKEVVENNIKGQAVTPYLLKRLNEITQGVSLGSNIDLVKNNATVGSQIAQALFEIENDKATMGDVTYSIPDSKNAHLKPGKRVLVVGGLVLDIISSSSFSIIRATSNIGAIHQASGGVGRNIAECLLRLGLDPLLISSVGNDASGSILLENLKKLGMDASGIQVSNDVATAVYSAVLCSEGDLDVAIADMRALDAINTSAISDKTIQEAGLVVADGNLSAPALKHLLERSASLNVDVWFEPTSVQKAVRVVDADAVAHMTYVSPNGDELKAISDAIQLKNGMTSPPHERFKLSEESRILPQERMHQLKNDIITVLLEMAGGDTKKEKHVIVTMGKHGVLVGSINMDPVALEKLAEFSTFPIEIWGMHQVHGGFQVAMVHLPGTEIQVKNCTGAGDSLVGGTVYGLTSGREIFQSCHLGMIAARQSLVSDNAINPSLTPEVLEGFNE